MNILITGGTGFVGSKLIEVLSRNNLNNLFLLSRKSDHTLNKSIKQIISVDPENFFKTAIPSDVDVVVHLAGRAHILNEEIESPIDEFRKVNVEGTLDLARQALKNNVKRFIFISSIGVNGAVTYTQAFTEDSKPNPHADYALSKYEAEQALTNLFKESKTELVIIRPPLVYAAHAPANFNRFMKIISSKLPLPFGLVSNKRSMIALANLVDFIICCITHPAAANELFLISDGEDLSTKQLVFYVANGMSRRKILVPIPIIILQIGAILINKPMIYKQLCCSLVVDSKKAFNVLGWRPVVSAHEALFESGNKFIKNN